MRACRAIERRSSREGVAAFLPAPGDDEDLITARAWLGWLELWRSEDILTNTADEIRGREILLLTQTLGLRPGQRDLTLTRAVIDGLTVAVCEPIRPLPPARARELLLAHVAADPDRRIPEAS